MTPYCTAQCIHSTAPKPPLDNNVVIINNHSTANSNEVLMFVMTLTFQLECVLDSCDCVEDVGEGHWIGNPQQELYWVVVVEG